ncbi:MAG: TM1266 family iron-only hydrogenase system putative regulator [Limnochordia bacterium]
MDKLCWGVIGIGVDNRHESALQVQEILTDFGDVILGRMGLPMRSADICIISLVIDGKSAKAHQLTERLSALPGVHVTHALSDCRPK